MNSPMRVIEFPRLPGRDHVIVRFEHTDDQLRQGMGYRPIGSEHICLQRCPVCGRENYALAVPSGVCYSCGFDANKLELQ